MTRPKWDVSLETGLPAVDEQHRTIIRMFDDFERDIRLARDTSLVEGTLVSLCEYVATHFSEEEELMERFDLPSEARDQHVEEHRRLTERTRELVLAHRAGEDSTLPLSGLVQEWLIDHILGVDRRLAAHIQLVSTEEEG